MKTKTELTESEIYFAAKNRRARWWRENWSNFILYPGGAAIGVLLLCMACTLIYQLGKACSDEPKLVSVSDIEQVKQESLGFQAESYAERSRQSAKNLELSTDNFELRQLISEQNRKVETLMQDIYFKENPIKILPMFTNSWTIATNYTNPAAFGITNLNLIYNSPK